MDTIELHQKAYTESLGDSQLNDKERKKAFSYLLNIELLNIKADRYKRKQARISEWVEADRILQDKYDKTLPPSTIYCSCGSPMQMSTKHLENYTDQPLRILFFFNCTSCKNRKAIYDNGEEMVSTPEPCPKCASEIVTNYKNKDSIITTIRKCTSCSLMKKDTEDLKKNHEGWEKKQQEDKELLTHYRDEYCSEEKGKEALETIESIEVAFEVQEEEKQKYLRLAQQRTAHFKKLTIIELQKLLTDALEKEQYTQLTLDKPEMGKTL